MKLKDGFILRSVAGEYMVMPTGENIADFGGTVVLNDVSAFIVELLKEEKTEEELLEAILAEYDIDRETAAADLKEVLEKLAGYNMI